MLNIRNSIHTLVVDLIKEWALQKCESRPRHDTMSSLTDGINHTRTHKLKDYCEANCIRWGKHIRQTTHSHTNFH